MKKTSKISKKRKRIKISLLKISFIISLLGILFLLFLVNLSPNQININEINKKLLNKNIQVQGTITNIKTLEDSDFQVITIKDSTGEIEVTLNHKSLILTKDQNIIVTGKITSYKENLQIQANKIISSLT